jgi:hypothetical protein
MISEELFRFQHLARDVEVFIADETIRCFFFFVFFESTPFYQLSGFENYESITRFDRKDH